MLHIQRYQDEHPALSLRIAASNNDATVVRRLLSNGRCAAPEASDALCVAAKFGHVEVVRLLLADMRPERALPNAHDSGTLRHAAERGHVEVVRLLLADRRDERALPNALDSYALRIAAERGHVEVVRHLLADPRPERVLPNAQNSEALRWAARRGHVEVVRCLMTDTRSERAMPMALDSNAIHLSAEKGHSGVVRLLLADARFERVRSIADGSYALRWAAENGHIEVVRLLLSDRRPDRVVPNVLESAALQQAASAGRVEVVRLLLMDPRPERVLTGDIDWHSLLVVYKALRLCRQLLAQPEVWSDHRGHRGRHPDALTKMVGALSPTVLRSMGVDWQLRRPLPNDNIWLPTQQRLRAWEQLEHQLIEDMGNLERRVTTLGRFSKQHNHTQTMDWVKEFLDELAERVERRRLLKGSWPALRIASRIKY